MLSFSSQSYFTRVFRNLTGLTPKQFKSDRLSINGAWPLCCQYICEGKSTPAGGSHSGHGSTMHLEVCYPVLALYRIFVISRRPLPGFQLAWGIICNDQSKATLSYTLYIPLSRRLLLVLLRYVPSMMFSNPCLRMISLILSTWGHLSWWRLSVTMHEERWTATSDFSISVFVRSFLPKCSRPPACDDDAVQIACRRNKSDDACPESGIVSSLAHFQTLPKKFSQRHISILFRSNE